MKIAYVLTRGDTTSGGAYIHVRDMATHAAASGHDVCVLVGDGDVVARALAPRGLDVVHVPGMGREISPARDARALVNLTRELRRFRPDVVSAHTAKAGWLARIAAASVGAPLIYTAHGVAYVDAVPWPRRFAYGMLEGALRPLTSHVIAVCDEDRRLALRYQTISPLRISCIPNGVHDIPASQRADPVRTPVRMCSIARFEPQKDFETLLDALATLIDLDWTLELYGGGAGEPEVRRRATELGLDSRIHYGGVFADSAPVLATAHLFVLSTHWEGLPRSILEAMRAGLPVVATEVGGVPEAVRDGETGYLFPRGDAAALAGRLRELLRDPVLRVRLGQAGRRRYEESFTFERMARETSGLYEQVRRRRQGVAAVEAGAGV